MYRGLKAIWVFLSAAWLWAEGNGTLVCSFNGTGKDPVYTIHCRMGKTILFEAPVEVERYVIGDPANWLVACKGNTVWLQAQQSGCQTSFFIIVQGDHPGMTSSVFCFELVETSRELADEFFEKIVILTSSEISEGGQHRSSAYPGGSDRSVPEGG